MITTVNMVTITDTKPRVLDNFPLILSFNTLIIIYLYNEYKNQSRYYAIKNRSIPTSVLDQY